MKKTKKKKRFTKRELDHFKKLLLYLRERVTSELDHIKNDALKKSPKESSGDLSGYGLHMADAASNHYDTQFRLDIASNEQDVLKAIDDALYRIKEGTYGLCEKYGIPIPKERLKAIPYARYSVKAQEEEEKKKVG